MTIRKPLGNLLAMGLWTLLLALAASGQALGAISLLGVSSGSTGSSGASSLTIAYPAGLSVNDVLIAQVAVRGNRTITAPSGWTLLNVTNNGSNLTQAVYWQLAAASNPASATWSFSASDRGAGAMTAYRGVDPSAPINVSSTTSNASSSNVTASSVTPSVGSTVLVGFFAQAQGNTTFTAPATMAGQISTSMTSAGPNGIATLFADEDYAGGTAATGSRIATTTNSATSIAHLLALKPAAAVSASLHHLEIRHGSDMGLTCTASTLTVVACQDAACAVPFTGGVSGTLSATGTPTVNWVGGNGFSIAAGSSSTSKDVQVTTAGSVVFGSSLGSATTCNFGSPSCTFTAADSGFLFDVPHHIAETLQSVTVSAVKKADNSLACSPAFANANKSVTFTCAYQNPASGTLPVRVGGSALNAGNSSSAACDASGQTLSLAFNASGTATTTVQYADVGQMRLNARYAPTSGSEAGLLMSGTDTFIAAPQSFAFSAVTAGPIRAGSNFSATLTSRNAAGSATPNFGQESSAESVTLSMTKYQPTGSAAANGSFSGSLGAFASGTASAANLQWSEVGLIDLIGTLASGNYLGSGLTATGSTGTGGAVGRFIPHHFVTAVTPGCAAGAFTYSGQPFTVRITAQNASSSTTLNYDGSASTSPNFAKTVTLSDAGSVANFSNNTLAASAFSGGVGSASSVTYTFATILPPATLTLRAVDTDNVSSLGFSEATNSIRYGRLWLGNAYGSELLNLAIPIGLQYWQDATAGWQTNSADSCTVLTASQFSFSFPSAANNHLAACETALTLSGTAPAYSLTLSSPGTGNDGWAVLTANLGASAAGNQCTAVGGAGAAATAANLAWLRYNWGGTGAADPSSVAAFGIYKSNLIDTREIY